MQKALERMNIKIANVLSDITGLSGMRMINAIPEGVGNPVGPARPAHSRCRASGEILEASLEVPGMRIICSNSSKASKTADIFGDRPASAT